MTNRFLTTLAAAAMAAAAIVPAKAQDAVPLETLPIWDVVLVAHRGLSAGYPENTLAAFNNVIGQGVKVIEIDLRGTKDGEIVILHDDTVDRTTNGTGNVGDLTLAEIRALDAGYKTGPEFAGQLVPTFAEVLDLATSSSIMLLLDIKLSPTLDREMVVRMVEDHDAALNVIAGVRSLDDLRLFRSYNPNIRTLGLIPEIADIEAFAQGGVDMIRLWPEWINGAELPAECNGVPTCLVERVHALNKPVWSTTGELGRAELIELIRLGVNGMLTDLPDVLDTLLDDIEAARADAT
ncbi:MAG: glycerophosphodiester phosphodiesterase family protein [Bauldia sp.]|nr:glycerophosphodiester phosphodiesterase family protein [Bauldia sp.]